MEEHDFLFDLVKRLDENEHRFVTKFAECNRRIPEKPLELLKAMRAAKRYDQRLFEAKFSNLNGVRHQLRQLILRALRAYRDGVSQDSEIRALILDYEILYEKGLYDEASRALNKAQELAKNTQNLGRMLEIFHLQKHRLLELERKDLPALMNEKVEAARQTLSDYIAQLEMINEYHQRFAHYRTEERPEDWVDMEPIDEALLNNVDAPFLTRFYGLLIAGLQVRSKRDFKAAKACHIQVLDLWRAHPQITKEQSGLYKVLLANYAIYLFPEHDLENVRNILVEIQSIDDRNFNEEAETFQNVANLKLLLQLNTFSKDNFDALVTEIEAGLEKYAHKINAARQFSIWYNLMLLYLIHEDYRKARIWIDRIIEHKRYQIRLEVQYSTRLLQLIVYHELQIWDTPESMQIALYRYFSRKVALTDFKREVLRIFTTLAGTPIHERKAVFKDLYDNLRQESASSNVADSLGMLAVTAWAGSKCTGKSILEILDDLQNNPE